MINESGKQLVYVAHPYGGKESNKKSIEEIMKRLILKDSGNIYVSAINNFGMVYFDTEYEKGLEICLELLMECEVLLLCGDWRSSKGCIGEWAFAQAKGIDSYTLEEWESTMIGEKRRW